MKIVKKENAKNIRNSDTSELLEYSIDLRDKDIDFCINTISGRYPEQGYCTNQEVKEICYILEGEGTINKIEAEGEDYKLEINFDKVGSKRLMAKFAGLEILD